MKRKNITIDGFARMIKKGFDETAKSKEMNTRFKGMDKRFNRIENKLDKLEAGHEDIQLRLGNVPFRFEVEDLKKRVKKLEFKAGIRRT